MTNAKGWSYSTGIRGKNRVRVYEERSGLLMLEVYERVDGQKRAKRKRVSLGHHDRKRAKHTADVTAARLGAGPALGTAEITLGSLFDIYEAEVTPRKSPGVQHHDRTAAQTFLAQWGRERPVSTLSLRDWEQFVDDRRAGRIGARGPVGDRQIQYDLSWLRAVFNWATKAGIQGQPLLARNPFQGYPVPRERNPRRPVLTEEQYQALCRAAEALDWRIGLALVFANETGHRISAIRQVRWSDVDVEQDRIRWRAIHDKIGHEHITPISPALHVALVAARQRSPAIGDAWVLPSKRHPERACPKGTLDHLFSAVAKQAKVSLPRGARWHSLRRKFATELKDIPLKDLCDLGGWKDAKTVLTCYQQPDEQRMREALLARRPFGAGQVSTHGFERTPLQNARVAPSS